MEEEQLEEEEEQPEEKEGQLVWFEEQLVRVMSSEGPMLGVEGQLVLEV